MMTKRRSVIADDSGLTEASHSTWEITNYEFSNLGQPITAHAPRDQAITITITINTSQYQAYPDSPSR